jgi:hypothetical protein
MMSVGCSIRRGRIIRALTFSSWAQAFRSGKLTDYGLIGPVGRRLDGSNREMGTDVLLREVEHVASDCDAGRTICQIAGMVPAIRAFYAFAVTVNGCLAEGDSRVATGDRIIFWPIDPKAHNGHESRQSRFMLTYDTVLTVMAMDRIVADERRAEGWPDSDPVCGIIVATIITVILFALLVVLERLPVILGL